MSEPARFGAIIGICTDRDADQRRAIESIRAYSAPDTEVYAIFNGVDPFPLPPGIKTVAFPGRIGREQGTWRALHLLAQAHGWAWACDFHDDFFLLESGWEDEVRALDATYRLAIAAFVGYSQITPRRNPETDYCNFESGNINVDGPLVVTVDGCGIAYSMHVFGPRRQFTPITAAVGFGETEAGNWALRNGLALARISKRAMHHPSGTANARTVHNYDMEGLTESIKPYLDILPARVVDAAHIDLNGKVIDVRRVDAQPARVRLFRPSYGWEEVDAATRVIRSGWTSSGPEVAAFATEFAAFVGAPYAVAVNSCTAALHLALANLDLHPGDEVIVPPITFASTAQAVYHAGAQPVFADVDPMTLCLDPTSLDAAWSDRTRAVIVVHYAGWPVDVNEIVRTAHGAPVIEDCAHAVGSTRDGRHVGVGPSAFACFSFHAVKNVSAGDGGAILCRTPEMAARLRRQRWCGIDQDTAARSAGPAYQWDYSVVDVGWKYQMTEIAAAIGRAQLRNLRALNARRRVVAQRYTTELSDVPWLQLPPRLPAGAESSQHMYPIRVPANARGRFMQFMADRGIETGVHYRPLNLHPVFASCRGRTPIAHQEGQRLVSLPMHAGLTDDAVARVIDAARAFTP